MAGYLMKQRLLRVSGPNFTAGAIFQKDHSTWRCVRAAPILNWFTRVIHVQVIYQWLRRNRLEFSWHKISAISRPRSDRGRSTGSVQTHDTSSDPARTLSPPQEANRKSAEKINKAAGLLGANDSQAPEPNLAVTAETAAPGVSLGSDPQRVTD